MLQDAPAKGGKALKVPLAEHFHSLQGEGRHFGTLMHFLRFPGCNVGRTFGAAEAGPGHLPVLPNGADAKLCTAFNGEHFWCDTDYGKHSEANAWDLVQETFERAACFTGGEPLMHQGNEWFKNLFRSFQDEKIAVHLETSGTYVPELYFNWITVSPKKGWLPAAVQRANQLKFVVSHTTELAKLEEVAQYADAWCEIYLSPIFDPNDLVRAHLDHALELLIQHPEWHLSVQVHKFLGLQ